jgi:hypothetical protein
MIDIARTSVHVDFINSTRIIFPTPKIIESIRTPRGMAMMISIYVK